MAFRFTIRQLEYLVAVGETGSIVAAAEQVNVSSPSISSAISQLEADLGIQIFIRKHARGLTLTTGGQKIYEQARQILRESSAVIDLANDITDTVQGVLTVGCLSTLTPILGVSLRQSFEEIYPDTEIILKSGYQTDLFQMLRRAEIDLALTYDLDTPEDISFVGTEILPPYAMVSVDHPLAKRGKISLTEISHLPMVLLDMPISRNYFLGIFERKGLAPNVVERTTDLAVMRSLVSNGYGYGLVNIRTATDIAPDGGKLALLELDDDLECVTIGCSTKFTSHMPKIVSAYIDHMKNRARDGSLPGIEVYDNRSRV